jgi:recombinational DNA repair protein RecR
MVKVIYYVLNKQICTLDKIKVNDKPLAELIQETDKDLEFLSVLRPQGNTF